MHFKYFLNSHVILIILLFISTNILGQTENYYNIKNGLTSNNVYAVKQDKRGFIWATTDKGVVRYDGKNFKLYTVDQGLASNDNFAMLIDSKDNVWLYSFKAISKIEVDGKCKVFGNTKSYFSHFVINKNDDIYYSVLDSLNPITNFGYYSHYCLHKENVYKLNVLTKNYLASHGFLLDNTYIAGGWDSQKKKLMSFKFEPNKFSSEGEASNINYNYYFGDIEIFKFIKNKEQFQVFSFKNFNSILKNSNKLRNYPYDMTRIGRGNILQVNSILYIVFNKGIYTFNIKTEVWSSFLNTPKATSILIDREKNVWVSTMGDGLVKYVNLDIETGKENLTIISTDAVKKVSGYKSQSLWIANAKNEVLELNNRRKKYAPDLIDLRFLEPDQFEDVYYGGSNAVYKNGKVFSNFGFKAMDIDKDSLALTTTFGVNFLNRKDLKSFKGYGNRQLTDITGRMYAVYYEKGLFYSGNQQGLYWGRPNRDELNPICLDPDEESVSVNGIKKSTDGLIWVSTDGRGVYVVRDKEPVRHFQNELLDGNINSMRIDEQDQVWLATRYGVNRISRNAHGEYQVSKYTSFHGLPSDFVNDTYCYNDTLYVATDAGLVRMDIAEIDRIDFSQPPPVYISKVICTAGSRPFMLKADSSYVLQHDQNFIKIEYSGISYRSNGNITYAYRLLPLISDWRYTGSDLIEFNDLNAGEYTFEVKAINSIGTVSSTPARYSFAIKPHFTRTWWFLTLCGIAITGLIYLAIYYYFDYIRRRNIEKAKIERQLSQLKLQSLQAQLNPHFIFNSLNAVQQLVNDVDLDQANIYLARFAKLMRLYLEGSDNQFITLKQEMEVLRLYIQLEHLRFKDKFVYNITISGDVNLDNYQVPAMLLQPHVENAIRHGLSRDTRPGRELNIIVKKQGEEVVVIINDNGIGRVKSLEQKRAGESGHKSMGNKISKQRIELIRALKLGNIREYIIDLEDNEGIANGTSVEIYISEKPTETITDETKGTDH